MDYRTIQLNPDPKLIAQSAMYRFFRPVTAFMMQTWTPTSIRGIEHIPTEGGVIVASNHLSVLDVPLMGVAIGRPTRFPSKPELFAHPFLSRFLSSLGGYPITRGEGDRKALSFSEQVLELGGALSIFPEGTRSRDGEVHSFHRGVALLAMSARVPIVPAAIWGSNRSFPPGATFPRPARIVITFGSPEWVHDFPTDPVKKKDESLRLTHLLECRVRELLEASRSG